MKVSNILIVILAVALVFLLIKLAFFSEKTGKAASEEVVLENIRTRTSIRAYKDKPIEEEKLEKLLRAAMAAPSAGNKQPWSFVVIQEKSLLSAISAEFRTASMVETAPLAIVVCADMQKTFPGDGLDYWVEDASAATENLLLAAHGMGLGAVWCGIYPLPERVSFLKSLLKLPKDIVPLCVVPVGYPAEDPEPKEKWNPENIHYNLWGSVSSTPITVTPKPKEWQRIDPTELHENPFTLFNDALALSVGNKEKMNAMTIGWGGLGVLWGMGRPVITVYVGEGRYTHNFMEENDYFTVTAFTHEYDKVLDYLGTVSGRDEDKMKGSGLTVKFTELGNPTFDEGRLILECKKLYGAPFNPAGFGELAKKQYSDRPLHSIYIGEIVNMWIKE